MRKITEIIFASGLALAVLISNIGSFLLYSYFLPELLSEQ